MKYVVIGPTYPYKGGISHFTTLLVRALRKRSNVEFISWKRQYPAFLYPVELKDKESKNPIQEDAKFLLDFFNPITWIQTALLIRKTKPQKIIFTWVSPIQAPIYFVIELFIRRSVAEIIFVCHNVLPHESTIFDKPLTKLALSQGDLFIVHSQLDKDNLGRIIKNKRIIKGFHPVYDVFNTKKKYDIEEIKKKLGLKRRVLLFFGYIRSYKGLKYLIEAMPEILKKFPDTSLLVAGDFWSKDKESYFQLINELNLKKNIVFVTQYIPNEEIGKYFVISDIAMFPYTSATQSGTLQVAKAFNIPIIATKVGGLADSIENGVNGYVVEPKSSKEIAGKVIDYFNAPLKRNNIGNNFTFDKYISQI